MLKEELIKELDALKKKYERAQNLNKKLKNELKESKNLKLRDFEYRYRHLFKHLQMGCLLTDLSGKIVDANNEFLQMIGSQIDDLTNKNHQEIIINPVNNLDQIMQEQALERGFSDTYQIDYRKKTGPQVPTEACIYPIYNNSKRPVGFWVFIKDISDWKKGQEKLKSSEEKYRTLAENANEAIVVVNKNRFIYYNRKFLELAGYTPEEINNQHPLDFIHPDDRELVMHYMDTKIQGLNSTPTAYQVRGIDSQDNIKWFQVNSTLLNWEDTPAALLMMSEITDLFNAEKTIVNSLREKEILLKEIHHRVKNNMQIISSLLNLQSEHIKNKEDLALFKESQNRIRAMSLVHESLYLSKDLANINFKIFISELISFLFSTYNVSKETITLDCSVDEIFLNINHAIPCALILNELISNALKYAFPEKKGGMILIHFTKEFNDNCKLVIADNGVGLPADIDFNHTHSLGLQLIRALVSQLKGTITIINDQGTRFELTIPTGNSL